MRLLRYGPSGKLNLTDNLFGEDIPQYAILSHTWGSEEVTFEDLKQNTAFGKPGYKKIEFCGEQAASDGLDYFWVDTCCIDKSSSAELQESITSMFRWYRNAAKCYVYLTDVSKSDCDTYDDAKDPAWETEFCQSRWFKRGWTLQELLAPEVVIFFDRNGSRLGDKELLRQQICNVTGIAEDALLRQKSLKDFNVSERFDWARYRETRRDEDWAYCLQGIFGVCFSPLYGEGKVEAVRRLVQEIKRALLDIEIQSLVDDAEGHNKIVNPLVLDIALLETKVFYDKTLEQYECYRSKYHSNAEILTANQVSVADMGTSFMSFLRAILWAIAFPLDIRGQLEWQLDLASITLHRAIDSNKRIAFDFQHDKKTVQETLDKMNKVQDFVRLVIKADGEEQVMVSQARDTPQQDAENVKLRYEFENLDRKYQKLEQQLSLMKEQVAAQEVEAIKECEKLERRQEDADRRRQEYENRTLWEQIWAWMRWLNPWGSEE